MDKSHECGTVNVIGEKRREFLALPCTVVFLKCGPEETANNGKKDIQDASDRNVPEPAINRTEREHAAR